MRGTTTDPRLTRGVVVPAGGVLTGTRVGVCGAEWERAVGPSAGERYRVLSVGAGYDATAVAVEVVPLADVPSGLLAVPEDLARATDFDAVDPGAWRMEAAPVVAARSVQLESPTERSLEEAGRELASAGLAGRALWVPADDQEMWLRTDSVPYRVRQFDAGGRREVIVTIEERTAVDLFVPGARSGVDIVVLADCSGSMKCEDIVPFAEYAAATATTSRWRGLIGSRTRASRGGLSRMRALQEALRHLLEVRLQAGGRVSRIALLEFTHHTRQIFPPGGGMAQIDAGTPAEADLFRNALGVLKAQNAGTDIGNALHEAANLLYHHHKPGNEKLIVLVSDGAHWTPKGEQGSGEVLMATEEPVSLMEHLHADTGIRLHAIGISTPQLYQDWLTGAQVQDHVSLRPDHALLAELVKVGGGDPAAVGGSEVLDEYFSGLGAGMTRRVQVTRARSAGLPAATAEALKEWRDRLAHTTGHPPPPDEGPGREAARERLSLAASRCAEAAQTALRTPLLDLMRVRDAIDRGLEGEHGVPDPRAFVRTVGRALPSQRPDGAAVPVAVRPHLHETERFLTGLAQEFDRVTATGPGPDTAWVVGRCDLLAELLESLTAALEAVPAAVPDPVPAGGGLPNRQVPVDEDPYDVQAALGTAGVGAGAGAGGMSVSTGLTFRLRE
ncbi:vWA domain-containing protein [Streptomyces herbicida]|uniref:vWA domain-containing protein n=1 Tax=Streptomyces herbicida TaxID=3065675 RepID=UPI0029314290|nr:vWA domain-containing protein [Streptomyces sp. NEAU-HV9]